MKWLRSEKGYPEDYPDKEIVEAAKILMRMENARPPFEDNPRRSRVD